MRAVIFDIKRFAVHDGDGIRTTVFFKGCPMRCLWCHNPEGLSTEKELAFTAHKCVSCGRCAAVCDAHTMENGVHIFHRERCRACGKCAAVCPADALRVYGETVDEHTLLNRLLEDRDFYDASGGGITLSGGECLLQADFCACLLRLCKEAGLRTAVDTCGCVPWESIEKVLPYTDRFLYDIKAIDDALHRRLTGVSNRLITENLKRLDGRGAEIEIRIPFVPHENDGEIERIGAFLRRFSHIVGVRVLPYHNLAATKYRALGLADTLPPLLPSEKVLSQAVRTLESFGLKML